MVSTSYKKRSNIDMAAKMHGQPSFNNYLKKEQQFFYSRCF